VRTDTCKRFADSVATPPVAKYASRVSNSGPAPPAGLHERAEHGVHQVDALFGGPPAEQTDSVQLPRLGRRPCTPASARSDRYSPSNSTGTPPASRLAPSATAASERLDRAAVAALRHGGVVYAVPAPRMPSTDPVAATLRY